MEIFKKWWFYVIAGIVIVLLPISIKYALQPAETAADDAFTVSEDRTEEAPSRGTAGVPADDPSLAGEQDASLETQTPPIEEQDAPVDEQNPPPMDEIPPAVPEDAPGREESVDITEDGVDGEPEGTDTDAEDPDDGPEVTDDSAEAPDDSAEVTYILNTNSRKFHLPTCPSVDDMKEKNRKETTLTREELIAQDWSPCGRCKP